MRIPSKLIWDGVGDFFSRNIKDRRRRVIEAFWQGLAESAADASAYVDYYNRAVNPFEVDAYAPYGNFPANVNFVDSESTIQGTLLGYRGGLWCVYTDEAALAPKNGTFSVLDTAQDYTDSMSDDLMSGADILKLKSSYSTVPWTNPTPSYLFGSSSPTRFSDRGSVSGVAQDDGLKFEVPWVNWAIMQDLYHMDGASSWNQLYRFKITKWDASTTRRTISINSFGDLGPDYEARFEDDGTRINLKFGALADTRNHTLTFGTNQIVRTRGSWIGDAFEVGYTIEVSGTAGNNGTYTVTSVTSNILEVSGTPFVSETTSTAVVRNELSLDYFDYSWRNELLTASESDPKWLEMRINYDAPSHTMSCDVWFDGQMRGQSTPYNVLPGRRTNGFDLFNQYGDMNVIADFVYTEGDIWELSKQEDASTSIGSYLSYVYETEEPLIGAKKLSSEPWDLSPSAEVQSHANGQIVLEIDEDYFDYAPLYAKIVSGSDYVTAERISQTGATATYSILTSSAIALTMTGDVTVQPWSTTDFQFISAGKFSTRQPIPFTQVWFRSALGQELDMDGRYGEMLGMQLREDSPEYLNAIRGTQYGLMSSFTPNNVKRAAAMIASIPYAKEAGTVGSITFIPEDIEYEVQIGGLAYRLDFFWGPYIKAVGTYINKYDSITTDVRVYDWVNNQPLIESRVGVWPSWGTFLVQIPWTFTLNQQSAYDLIDYIKRSKSIHTDFVVEYLLALSENPLDASDVRDRVYTRESIINETFTNTREDLTFDDHGSVVGQDLAFQTVDGQDYSEEYQFGTTYSLTNGHALNNGIALGGNLTLLDPKRMVVNGGTPYHYYANGEVNAKANTGPFAKNPYKFHQAGTIWPQGHKPYTLLWVREPGGAMVTYAESGWVDFSPSLSTSTITNMGIVNNKIIHATTGANDEIYRSVNGGKAWSVDTVVGPTGNTFNSVSRNYAVQQVAGKFWTRGSTGWVESAPANWAAFTPSDIWFIDDNTGFAIGDDAGSVKCSSTTDGGATWTVPTLVVAAATGRDVHFYNSLQGWASTSIGLYRTADGGATWTNVIAATSILSARQISSTVVVASGTTNIYEVTDAFGTPATTTHANPGGSTGIVNEVGYADGGIVYAVIDSGAVKIVKSTDFGATWADDTPSAGITPALKCMAVNNKLRLAAGASDAVWKKL